MENSEEPSEVASGETDNFDVVDNDDGSATITPKKEPDSGTEPEDFYTLNLATLLDEGERDDIALEYIPLIEKDRDDRKKHDEQCKKALESTGLTGDAAPAFPGGSILVHPVLAQASVQFYSSAIKEIFPAEGPVRTAIKGKTTRKKLDKAERKRQHMNWQLTEQIQEYEDSVAKMLPMICLWGSQYMRLYWWETGKRPRAEYIPSDKIYLPYHVSNFYSSQRITYEEEISTMEYELRIDSGLYSEFDEVEVETSGGSDPSDTSATQRAERRIEGKALQDDEGEESRIVYNVYCYRKLEKDGEADGYAPYIISINKHTNELLAIYRNWEYKDETRQAMQWIIEWPMIPWGRIIYTIGTGHLVGQLARGASGALRALLDSALAQTAPTLFMTKAVGMSGQSVPVQLGAINQLRTNAGLDDIRKSIMAPPFNPPSNVLFELLGFLVDAASGMVRSTITDVDATTNVPVGTQLSRVEQGMKVFSAIHKGLHKAQKRTLTVLHRLNRMYMEDNGSPEDFVNKDDAPLAFKSDYEGDMDVMPVSDPEIFSEQQRLMQAQATYALARENPDKMDIKAAIKRMLSAMKVPAQEELLPDPLEPHDENPAAENIKMSMGTMALALPDQDHLAHLQTHLDYYTSPAYGKNPAILPQLAPQMLKHLVQHLIFNYGQLMQDKIKEAVSPDYQGDIKELIGEDSAVMKEMSMAMAAASPMVTEDSAKLFEKALPIIAELAQMVQKMQPPPPVDPGNAMLQAEQIRAQTKQADTQANMQVKQTDLQVKQANDAAEINVEKERIQMEELKNSEDNTTALIIAKMHGDAKPAIHANPRA